MVVDGNEEQLPVTLADRALALVYRVVIGVLIKRLPGLLERVLMERFGVSIAFPQRDLHFDRDASLNIRLERGLTRRRTDHGTDDPLPNGA